jgi:hypothetical protein
MSLVLLGLVLSTLWVPAPAVAHTLPTVQLELDKNYYTSSDHFSASGTIINTSPEHALNAELAISIFPALERGEPLFGRAATDVNPLTCERWHRELSVGLTKVSVNKDLSGLELDEGVYPVEFAVTFPDRLTLLERSFLVVMDTQPKRLPIALVWSLHSGEHRLPDGTFLDNSLADLVKRDPRNQGLLSRYLDMVEANPGLKINLAAGPTLTGQLSAMGAGYDVLEDRKTRHWEQDSPAARDARAWLDRLAKLGKSDHLDILTSPYGEAPLPTLASLGWKIDVQNQIEMAKKTNPFPENKPTGFYLPGLAADDYTAGQLIRNGFKQALTLGRGEPGSTATPQPPYRLERKEGNLTILAADPEIASWLVFANPEQVGKELTALLAQRFLSAGEKDAVIITPAIDSPPNPDLANRIYATLNDLPWIETTILPSLTEKAQRTASLHSAKDNSINTDYRDDVIVSRRLWRNFAAAIPENNPVGQRMTQHMYRAQSIDFLSSSGAYPSGIGEAYLTDTSQTIKGEFAKIELKPPRAVTFSTKIGKIPVAVFNGTGYPIKTRLNIKGKDFSFPDDMKQKVVLKPKENLVSYKVEAGFTGVRVLNVTMSIGNFEIAGQEVEVTVSNMLRVLVVAGTSFMILALGAIVLVGRYRK